MQQLIEYGVKFVAFFAKKYYAYKFPPFIIRKGTSDINVFISIFLLRDLDLQLKMEPKLIVDAGAYTGLSTLFYASKFPRAKIIAIEPEQSNFEILERNTGGIKNVDRIQAGLWNRDACLKIIDRQTGKWGFAIKEVSGGEKHDIKAVTIDTILKTSGVQEIDILKIDIEGSEKELFSGDCNAWIDKVKVIVVELHDRFKEGCTSAVLSAINQDKWDKFQKGDKTVFVRKMSENKEKMIKVAHLITGLEVGGTERSLLALLPRVQNKGILNYVYCIVGQGEIGKELVEKGIPVKYLGYNRWWDIFKICFYFFREMRREKPDILVTYLIHADLFGRIIGYFSGIKKVVSYKRGSLLQWDFLYYGGRMTRGLVKRYITVSRELKNILIDRSHIDEKNITVIKNGIDVEKYLGSNLERERIRKEFGIASSEIIFGIIAKLRKGKGHRDLIVAFNEVLKERPEVIKKLLIVGDGEEEQDLKKYVGELKMEKSVIFTGCRKDVASILSAIDIFVFPTEYEGMSVALLEAMAAKKTIITTSIAANLEVVDATSALIVPPRDVKALTFAMHDIMLDTDLQQRLAEAAFKRCQENYSLDNSAQQFLALLKSL